MGLFALAAIGLAVCGSPEVLERSPLPPGMRDGLPFCDTCNHTGRAICLRCHGKGKIFQDCPKCGGTGRRTCPHCKGQGQNACGSCFGKGFWTTASGEDPSPCPFCLGRRVLPCLTCASKGFLLCRETKLRMICPECRYIGKVPCPNCRDRLRAMMGRQVRGLSLLADYLRWWGLVAIEPLTRPWREEREIHRRLANVPGGEPNGIDR
jgi:hypothetical protein